MQRREASIIVFMSQVTIISRLKFFNLVESQFPELGLGEKGNWESTQVKKNLNLILTCNNYNNYQNQTTRGFPGGHSQKTPLSLRINAFNAKVLLNWGIESTTFYVSSRRRDRHFTWSSEPRGPAACRAKAVLSFSVILRPWVLVRPRGSNTRG